MNAIFQKVSEEEFFKKYFKKEPLLIRGVYSKDELPFTEPDELASLAVEENTVSRLIRQTKTNAWEMEYGPFDLSLLENLPKSHWTLLIQRVNSFFPKAQDFLSEFRFLPNWSLDDLMISIAAEGGGVGPHLDRYDVFLIQAHGKRKWQVGREQLDLGSKEAEFEPNLPVKILKQPTSDSEWDVEPGDVIYLPPRVVHNGVATELCLTYSVGFRAPSVLDHLIFAMSKTSEELLLDDLDWRSLANDSVPKKVDLDTIRNRLALHFESLLTDEHLKQFISTSRIGGEEIPEINIYESGGNGLVRFNPAVVVVMSQIESEAISFYTNGHLQRIPKRTWTKTFLSNGRIGVENFHDDLECQQWLEGAIQKDLVYRESE